MIQYQKDAMHFRWNQSLATDETLRPHRLTHIMHEWVSNSTPNKSFQRRIFPGNQLHRYWQQNSQKKNEKIHNTRTQKNNLKKNELALVNKKQTTHANLNLTLSFPFILQTPSVPKCSLLEGYEHPNTNWHFFLNTPLWQYHRLHSGLRLQQENQHTIVTRSLTAFWSTLAARESLRSLDAIVPR